LKAKIPPKLRPIPPIKNMPGLAMAIGPNILAAVREPMTERRELL